MKKKIMMLLTVLIFASVFLFCVSLKGETSSDNQLLSALIQEEHVYTKLLESEKKILEYQQGQIQEQISENLLLPGNEENIALLQNRVDILSAEKMYKEGLTYQQVKIEQYQIQNLYYQSYLLQEELKLEQRKLESAEKWLLLMEEGVKEGERLEIDYHEAQYQKKEIENRVAILQTQIQDEQKKMNQRSENMNVSFAKTEADFKQNMETVFTLEELKSSWGINHIERNHRQNLFGIYIRFSEVLKGIVGDADFSYLEAMEMATKLKLEQEQIEQKVGIYIEAEYLSYEGMQQAWMIAQEKEPILIQKTKIIQERYDAGVISEWEYLSTKTNIENEKFEIRQLYVQLLKQIEVLELIRDGIVLE